MATTPWGTSQYSKKYGRGVVFYGTAGHGGFHVCPTLNAAMPDHLRIASGWYEEDCDYARVMLAFPDRFTAEDLVNAETTLRAWAPDAWEQHYGRTLGPGESYVRERQTFDARHMNDYVVVAAWGDWHANVPTGFVGVCARRMSDKRECYALVSSDEYHQPGHGYVLTADQVDSWIGPNATPAAVLTTR